MVGLFFNKALELVCIDRNCSLLDALLNKFDHLNNKEASLPKILPYAVEASWVTSEWYRLESYLSMASEQGIKEFNTGIGLAFSALRQQDSNSFREIVEELRDNVAKTMTSNSTVSLQTSHDSLLRLHVLTEIEAMAYPEVTYNGAPTFETLDRRLDILGGCISEKQYLLGLRRATMELS